MLLASGPGRALRAAFMRRFRHSLPAGFGDQVQLPRIVASHVAYTTTEVGAGIATESSQTWEHCRQPNCAKSAGTYGPDMPRKGFRRRRGCDPKVPSAERVGFEHTRPVPGSRAFR